MGQICGGSRYNKVYEFEPKLAEWRSDFDALQFKEQDIGRLYRIYNLIDADKSGLIDYVEMLTYLSIERTAFSKRVFTMFDDDGSGKLDFREFVMSLWNYCTLSKDTLVVFTFDIYDRDSSGEIEAKEVQQMLKEIYGKTFKNNTQAKQIANEIDVKLGDVDIEEFKEFARTHPALLFPAFLMQMTLHKGTLGESFWKYYSTRRIELSKGQYIPISQFMEVHTDKELKRRLTTDIAGKKMNKKTLEIIEKTGTASDRRMSKIAVTDHDIHHKDKVAGHGHDGKRHSIASTPHHNQHKDNVADGRRQSIASISIATQSVELLHHPHPEKYFENNKSTGKGSDNSKDILSCRRGSFDKGHEEPSSSRRNSFDKGHSNNEHDSKASRDSHRATKSGIIVNGKSLGKGSDDSKDILSSRRGSFDKGHEAPSSTRRNSFDKDKRT